MVTVYKCGIKVITVIGNIEGMITGVSIRFEKVQYEVSFFYDGEQRCYWMHEQEFITNEEKVKIGFK
jgi:hypothetical protein